MQPTNKKPADSSKSSYWYWVALVLVIICAAVIRIRLLSIPLERDEGEYAYIAQQMLKGVPPYESAYSMKLPGIYAVYALFLAIFGQTLIAIHLGLVIFNAATIFAIFWLTRRLFGDLAAVVAAAAFAVTSLTRPVLGLSANAEHFVVLPALVGVLLIAKAVERRSMLAVFIAALLFGLAFIIKQHGIFFSVFAAAYLLYSDLCHRPFRLAKTILNQLVFVTGAVLPFVFICLFYWYIGVFDKFWFWTFTYASKYATVVPMAQVPGIFWIKFGHLVYFTVPVWLFTLLGMFWLLFSRRIRPNAPFVLGFFVFSFISVCPGFYFREHYFVLLLPAAVILAGAGFSGLCDWVVGPISGPRRSIAIILAVLVVVGYTLFYQRMYLFDDGGDKVCRRIYGANPFPESVQIADFIRANSRPDDTIAVIGSEPQIYFYSGRRAATRYIYTYPLMESHKYAAEMQKEMIGEMESAEPEFLVFVSIPTSWLDGPDSKRDIFTWFESYVNNYNLVGIVEIPPFDQAVYYWNSQAADRTPVSSFWVAIFKRRY